MSGPDDLVPGEEPVFVALPGEALAERVDALIPVLAQVAALAVDGLVCPAEFRHHRGEYVAVGSVQLLVYVEVSRTGETT